MQTTTIVHEQHNRRTSKSPIRKQLAKKLVSYYNQLDQERSKSPGRRTMPQSRKHFRTNSILSPKKKRRAVKKQGYYFDPKMRKQQLEELRDLMYSELHRAQVEDALSHDDIDLYETMTGYPSFVRETADALKMKHQMRKEPWKSSNGDFKPPVHKVLEERVYHSQIHSEPGERDPAVSVGRVTTSHYHSPVGVKTTTTYSHPVYDSKLYHLNTSEKIAKGNSAEYDQIDFHERKAKEIRRLQYVADWEARRKRKRSRTPIKRRKWKVTKFRELADILSREQLEREEKIRMILELERLLCNEFNSVDSAIRIKRSDPAVAHPIWIELGSTCYPGRVLCPQGFKISKFTNTFEVREGDEVIIHANELEGSEFAPKGFVAQGLPKSFIGVVKKPTQADLRICEHRPNFIIEEPTGERYPILLNQPEIVNEVVSTSTQLIGNSNCDVFNGRGQFVGRGDLKLTNAGNDTFLYKGLMIDRDNLVQYVLLNRQGPNTVEYKGADGQRFIASIDQEDAIVYENFGGPVKSTVKNVSYDRYNNKTTTIQNVTSYPTESAQVQILTLKESDQSRPQRKIYFVEERLIGVQSRHSLLHGEEATVFCDNLNAYEGKIEIDRSNNVFLRVFPCKENEYSNNEVLRINLGEAEVYPFDISNLQRKVEIIANERANNWVSPCGFNQVNVGVVDNKGNQMNVTVSNRTNCSIYHNQSEPALNNRRSKKAQRKVGSGMGSSRVSVTSNQSLQSEAILNSIQSKLIGMNLDPKRQVRKSTYVEQGPITETIVTESVIEAPRRAPKPRTRTKRVVEKQLFATPSKVTEIQENIRISHRAPEVTKKTTTTSYKPDKRSLRKTTKTSTTVKPQRPSVHVDRRVKTTSNINRPRAKKVDVTSYSYGHEHTFGRRENPIIEETEIIEEQTEIRKAPKRGRVKIDVDVENNEDVEIKVKSRSPSPRKNQRTVTRTTNRTPKQRFTILEEEEEVITTTTTNRNGQRQTVVTKKSPHSAKRTHYTEHSVVQEDSPISPFKSHTSGTKTVTKYENGVPVSVKKTNLGNSAAKKIQKEWRHFQWKKDYNSEESDEEGVYESIHDQKLETLRDTLGNDQDFARFLNFYKTLPDNVEYEKAYQLFQNMMNQLIC